MNAVADTTVQASPAGKAAWITLAIAWLCFLVPFPGLGLFLGWPLNLVAFILAIVAMAKGGAMKGLFQLLGSIIVSPIVYFVGLAIFAGTVSGISAQSKGQYDTAVAEASVSSAAAEADAAAKAAEPAATAVTNDAAAASASAVEVTATTMFSDYQDNEIAADGKYKGKALLVSGTVDSISSDFMDKPVVQLSAKPFGFVQASDLPKDVAATLKKGQKVTLACTGNGEVIGFPALSGCTVQ
ncbi:OB-fold protein [Stenotrophomonas indicatrix]|uniref:OB-fold protein n=1 Tax=Stenotrophomonas indicatrix TaxID=2045451 RepID=UPI0028A62811|nr:hypothetical protein [Stenotrophomonas indicatrix]